MTVNQRSRQASSLLVAYPKGRLGDELLLKLAGSPLAPAVDPGRALKVPAGESGVELVFLKGADLVEYVARNVAALGVVGSDALDEKDTDVLELADLGLGRCRLSVSAPVGVTLESLARKRHLRLATKFVRRTQLWLARRGLTAELVPLTSSIELAPALGLADAIVDLVQTGRTLVENGLEEIECITQVSGRLIAARGAYLSNPTRIDALAAQITRACR
jgi:ATP phosphoribosyltransferase